MVRKWKWSLLAYTGLSRNCRNCMLRLCMSKLSPSSRTFGGLECVLAACRRFRGVYVLQILSSRTSFDLMPACFVARFVVNSPLMKIGFTLTRRVCERSSLEGFGRQGENMNRPIIEVAFLDTSMSLQETIRCS